jgi:hypothetical protein
MGIGSSIPRFADTVIQQIKQDSFKDGKSCNASPFFKIEARLLGEGVRFFAQVATGTRCAQPTMVMRAQICRRDLPRGELDHGASTPQSRP